MGRFDQNELTLVWPNHANVPNDWRVRAEPHFAPKFHPVARRFKLLQING